MEKKKIWFIEIDKMFQEKNLKILYLPVLSLEKLLRYQECFKIPDPLNYFAGFAIMPNNNSRPELNTQKDLMFVNKNKENDTSPIQKYVK